MSRLGRLFIILGLSVVVTVPASAADDRGRLVLVTAAGSQLAPLSNAQLQRLFLGLPVSAQGRAVHALRNRSERLLYEVFLQKVIYMSARTYERQLASRVLLGGGHRPAEFTDQASLIQALSQRPLSVTYMWEQTAAAQPQLEIVQYLWKGRGE